jgi:23S rRNA pseudouridine1911/1915/1917 synthase
LEAKGARLDHHLAQAFPDLTRSRLKTLIEEGRATLDGNPAKPALRLRGGERIRLELPPPVPAKPGAEALPVHVLYEDADVIVVDKAAGMVVHPAAGNWTGTLVNALLAHVKDLGGVGGELRPGLVHRIDKDTSGCLVVAKNERALSALQASFKSREVAKTYLALVHGQTPERGRMETLYGRHPVHRKRFTGKVREGKPALTEYVRRELFDEASLVEVALHTGRTHQIRVHFSEAKHPLLGDELYGGSKRGGPLVREAMERLGRQALHAWKLSFPHPRKSRQVSVEAPIPADFDSALKLLRTPIK